MMKTRKKYKQGKFNPLNPQKYKGNPNEIYYRSGWELKLMILFDNNPNILQWSSEEIVIPYRDPINGHRRRYFPDFWIKKKEKDNQIIEEIIEVKPFKETIIPVKGRKKPRTLLAEQVKFVTNQAKFEAATDTCKKMGWKFTIITEKDHKF